MAEPKVDIAKIARLVEAGRELNVKAAEVLDEIDALIGGKAGIGADMKLLEQTFDRIWCARYAPGQHGRYVWSYAKDKPQMKRLLKSLGCDEVMKRIGRYLASDEPFYVRTRHSFGAFVSSINSHAAQTEPGDFELVAGCRHDPPCRNDVEHTKRRTAEMRS